MFAQRAGSLDRFALILEHARVGAARAFPRVAYAPQPAHLVVSNAREAGSVVAVNFAHDVVLSRSMINGQQPNGQQPNGQQPNGQQPNGQQPNGQHGGKCAQRLRETKVPQLL